MRNGSIPPYSTAVILSEVKGSPSSDEKGRGSPDQVEGRLFDTLRMTWLEGASSILMLCLFLAPTLRAQTYVESVGGQVGSPTAAISLRGQVTGIQSIGEVGFSFEDEFVDVAGFAFTLGTIDDSPMRYYVGPGATVRLDSGTLRMGLLAAGGLMFETGQFEVFVQAAPVIYLLPETNADLRVAVGLRYLLGR